jgi:hypothetical protein
LTAIGDWDCPLTDYRLTIDDWRLTIDDRLATDDWRLATDMASPLMQPGRNVGKTAAGRPNHSDSVGTITEMVASNGVYCYTQRRSTFSPKTVAPSQPES